ncbi:MAG: tyrosine-type recombinase/integrase [Zoogloeaceae bacterium]|jgi:hypothetical protein|nr:tyrosine-type recombinase/integrase [Zoogloeaceae bacterium]
MGRKPSVNFNLPAGMRVKRLAGGKAWYYLETRAPDGKRKWEPLGNDYPEALRRYADRVETATAPAVTVPEMLTAWLAATLPGRKPGTQKDIQYCLPNLLEFFGNPPATLEDVEPHHVRQYLDWRKAKVRANREIAWFSAAWNWARDTGKTRAQNPTQGVKRNKETGRSIYVEDDELYALLFHADEPLKEAMELAYLIGQRPCDLRGISETDIRDNAISVTQDKTGAKLRIEITGDLAALVERIRARKASIKGVRSLALICDEKGLPLTKSSLRRRFDEARIRAAESAPTPGQAARIRSIQFRDLRAKAASDVENLERAQAIMGHTRIAMTEHYVRNRKGKKIAPVR